MADQDVFGFLLAQVQKAQARFWKAKDRFWAVAMKPEYRDPARMELLHAAIAEENFAMRAYRDAMLRLNRYLREGTIPDEPRKCD